jgi:uncharacterized cupredoxin-like copper-binding protein
MHEDMPMNPRHIAASGLLLLAITACTGSAPATPVPSGSAVASSAPASGASAEASTTGTSITVKDFTLEPKDLTLTSPATLAVTNAGPTVPNVAVRDAGGAVVGTTTDLKAGASEPLALSLPAGSFVLFCSLPGHESLGIKGTLTVTK